MHVSGLSLVRALLQSSRHTSTEERKNLTFFDLKDGRESLIGYIMLSLMVARFLVSISMS